MSVNVTGQAIRELFVHARAMRLSMTGGAFRNLFVLGLMAINTKKGMVFTRIFIQHFEFFFMTTAAVTRRNFTIIFDQSWHVRLVAT